MTKRLADMSDVERKAVKLAAILEAFPDAFVEIALVAAEGQRQHGTTGWDKTKSTDHKNCLLRHLVQAGTLDKDGRRHSGKVAWRAFAALQIEIEADRAAAARRKAKRRRATKARRHR